MTKDEVIKLFKEAGKPLTFDEISRRFFLETGKERNRLKRILKKLVKKGEIHITKSNTYCYSTEANLVKGTVDFAQGGFAFLIPDEEGYQGKDIFLKPSTLFEALNGDRALVRIDKIKNNKKPEGTIIKILERKTEEVVGIFQKNKGFAFVTPIDKKLMRDFYIPEKKFKNAANGDVVQVRILSYPSKNQNPVGEVIKVLGKPEDDSTFFSSVNIKYGVKEKFPKKVIKASNDLKVKEKSDKRRKDLTNIRFFTIDGESARDFDDAVAITRTESGNFKLYVSIADVEYYVKEKSVIDKEAYLRATSVYYPHKVYPMLPEVLSNNLCSLNPFEKKLSFTVEMEIEPHGNVVDYKIYKSVIKSYLRATYSDVYSVLTSPSKLPDKKYAPVAEDILLMGELAEILRKSRFQKGSIDFNLPEVGIVFDENGKVKELQQIERNKAHILIEEFMLLANEVVAQYLSQKSIPLLYRVHEVPDEEKLADVAALLKQFDIYGRLKTPVDIQKALEAVKGKPFEKLFNYLLLRCMKQAKYSPENIGHYALAKQNYTHFTSPIRRYPDLVNHRILRRAINKKITGKYIDILNANLPETGLYCSERERSASDAEREVVDYLKISFMENKLNEEFKGTVTGVTSFGFFVEIDPYLVEGLVHLRNLTDDYYQYFEQEHLVRGKRRGNFYRLGDSVMVKIEKIDKINRLIDFSLIKKINDN